MQAELEVAGGRDGAAAVAQLALVVKPAPGRAAGDCGPVGPSPCARTPPVEATTRRPMRSNGR